MITMSKNPFDYVKSINHKQHNDDLTGYNPFLTNKCFAMHLDTILLAEEMNQAHRLPPNLQYEFYYNAVRKGKRFGFPPKPSKEEQLSVITEYYKCSEQKAREYLRLLTPEQISVIMERQNKGGR